MKGFAPSAESHGFSPDLLWSVLRSGCRATKSRRSQSESAKLSLATGLSARSKADLPWASTGITDNEWFAFLSQQPGIDEVKFWQVKANRVASPQS